jgi:Flp pilus assembly pilin Flp
LEITAHFHATPNEPTRQLPVFVANLRSRGVAISQGVTNMEVIKNFFLDESGMETLEYAVIAGLIAAAAIIVYASGWSTTLLNRLNAASNTN